VAQGVDSEFKLQYQKKKKVRAILFHSGCIHDFKPLFYKSYHHLIHFPIA
jgi:hypothetical protein